MVQHARKYISRVKTPKCLKSHLRACKKHEKKALSAGRETGHRAVHNSKIVELSVIQKQRLKQNCFSEDVRKSAVFHVASIAGFQVTVIFKWSSLPCKPAHPFWDTGPVTIANGVPTCVVQMGFRKPIIQKERTLPSLGPYWCKIYKLSSELATGKKSIIF